MSLKLGKFAYPKGYGGWLECKVCRGKWQTRVKPDSNGRFYRGSWQCPYGCTQEDLKALKKKS